MRRRVGLLFEHSAVSERYLRWVLRLVPLGEHIDFEFIYQTSPTPREFRTTTPRDKCRLWMVREQILSLRQPSWMALAELATPFSNVEFVELAPVSYATGRMRLSDHDEKTLRNREYDALVRVGFGLLSSQVLGLGRIGTLSFHYGDKRSYRGSPPLFWEMFFDEVFAQAEVQVLSSRIDAGQTVVRKAYRIDYSKSYLANLDAFFAASDELMADAIRAVLALSPNSGNDLSDAGVLRSLPTDRQYVRFTLRNSVRALGNKLHGLLFNRRVVD